MTETMPRTNPASRTLLIVISMVVIAVVALVMTGMHLSNPYLAEGSWRCSALNFTLT